MKDKTGDVELTSDGFKVRHNGTYIEMYWEAIEKVHGYLEDEGTYEDAWLRLETENNTVFISQSFTGWTMFIHTFHSQFPEIDRDWSSKLHPASLKRETTLYVYE